MRGIRVLTGKLRGVLEDPLLLGQVLKPMSSDQQKRVKVIKMQLDKSLKMYFNKSIELTCTDTANISKTGDVVLLQRIQPQVKPFEYYKVTEVVYKTGLTIDPITNEKLNKTSLEAV